MINQSLFYIEKKFPTYKKIYIGAKKEGYLKRRRPKCQINKYELCYASI